MEWQSVYEIEMSIAAPPSIVWAVIADGEAWSTWSFIPRSALETEGSPDRDGVGAVRKFGLAPFQSRERVVEFDPPRRFAYEAVRGVPVKAYRAQIDLVPTGEQGDATVVTWQGSMVPKYRFANRVVEAYLRTAVRKLAAGLKSECERRAAER